jgi:AcrR family transcriptional regulator
MTPPDDTDRGRARASGAGARRASGGGSCASGGGSRAGGSGAGSRAGGGGSRAGGSGAGAPRTSAGDPARTLALLWRVPAPARRGPRPRLDVDAVVGEAIALADEQGLAAVTMRALAARLGVSAMTLYGYVPGKEELLDLMLDALYAGMERAPWAAGAGWRERARVVAAANRALFAAHPWAAAVSTVRPPLGPGLMAKYEHELAVFEGAGLGDVERDSALSFLLAFVRGIAAAAAEAAGAPGTDEAWWEAAGPLLARAVDPARYPLAARVGTAAGEAHGSAYDPEQAYEFGLERVLDGLAALVGPGR